jgi:hypothetical protein
VRVERGREEDVHDLSEGRSEGMKGGEMEVDHGDVDQSVQSASERIWWTRYEKGSE